ncbi:hypothetical protein CCP2SC5_840004 [Azospirillaceae bacterium]
MVAVVQKQNVTPNVVELPRRAPSPPKTLVDLVCAMRAYEREHWFARARELGFQPKMETALYIDARPTLPNCVALWVGFVGDELRDAKIWNAPEEETEKEETNFSLGALATVIQLPVWGENWRAVPNDVLRSALFAALSRSTRRAMAGEVIASSSNVVITFTGEQLDQSDFDVWAYCVHLCRAQELGARCVFRAGTFLKMIGRNDGRAQYKWLKSSLDRLALCVITVRTSDGTCRYKLVKCEERDEDTKEYNVSIDPKMAELYAKNWSLFDWEQRAALRGKPIALWLHGYYSTHAEPLPLKVVTIKERCGSENKALYDFRRSLRQALDALKSIGALASWSIDSKHDLVSVNRGAAISDSQRRYLERKEYVSEA